jgi:uncharacterized protein (TIGR00369 family)
VSTTQATEVWREDVRGGYPDTRMLALSGRERLESWVRGHVPAPPLSRLTGAVFTEVGSGTASAVMPATGWLLNSAGAIGGGTLAILADIAFGCSIQTELGPGVPYTTAELSMTFLRPAKLGCTLSAGGQAIHVGRSVALSEAFVIEEGSERLIAHGTSRCAVLPAIEPLPELPAELPIVEPDPDADSDPYRRPWPTDKVLPQEIWDRLSGKEVIARQSAGELPPPPIHYLTGIRVDEFGDGTATMRLPATAVETTAPAGTAFAGLDLKVNYLRPVFPDGREFTARASVIHRGRTLVVTQAEVENADGKRVALATGSSMYLPGRPANLGEVELAAEAEDSSDAAQ